MRFRSEFAELASTAAGIGDNPFPASIEVRMQRSAEADGRADALLQTGGHAAGRGRRALRPRMAGQGGRRARRAAARRAACSRS